jgi:hypothetical protein
VWRCKWMRFVTKHTRGHKRTKTTGWNQKCRFQRVGNLFLKKLRNGSYKFSICRYSNVDPLVYHTALSDSWLSAQHQFSGLCPEEWSSRFVKEMLVKPFTICGTFKMIYLVLYRTAITIFHHCTFVRGWYIATIVSHCVVNAKVSLLTDA